MVAICNGSAVYIILQNERKENEKEVCVVWREKENERPGRESGALPPPTIFHDPGASPRNFSSLFLTHFHVVLDYFRKHFSAATNLLFTAAMPVASSLHPFMYECVCVLLLSFSVLVCVQSCSKAYF